MQTNTTITVNDKGLSPYNLYYSVIDKRVELGRNGRES